MAQQYYIAKLVIFVSARVRISGCIILARTFRSQLGCTNAAVDSRPVADMSRRSGSWPNIL